MEAQRIIRGYLGRVGTEKLKDFRSEIRAWCQPVYATDFLTELLKNKVISSACMHTESSEYSLLIIITNITNTISTSKSLQLWRVPNLQNHFPRICENFSAKVILLD